LVITVAIAAIINIRTAILATAILNIRAPIIHIRAATTVITHVITMATIIIITAIIIIISIFTIIVTSSWSTPLEARSYEAGARRYMQQGGMSERNINRFPLFPHGHGHIARCLARMQAPMQSNNLLWNPFGYALALSQVEEKADCKQHESILKHALKTSL
jgi:hypothetical protein